MGGFSPTWPNGAVGGIDGVGHAVKRVFDKARTRAILQFCPLRQEKSAALFAALYVANESIWLQLRLR
jgi:hypothetical protein